VAMSRAETAPLLPADAAAHRVAALSGIATGNTLADTASADAVTRTRSLDVPQAIPLGPPVPSGSVANIPYAAAAGPEPWPPVERRSRRAVVVAGLGLVLLGVLIVIVIGLFSPSRDKKDDKLKQAAKDQTTPAAKNTLPVRLLEEASRQLEVTGKLRLA